MKEVRIRTYSPTPKQVEAHLSEAKYVLYGGSMGGGKTAFLVNAAIDMMIQYPGNRGFIGRKQFSDFKISTYLQLIKFLQPYFNNKLVEENKGDKVFRFWNKSELYYGQFDDDSEGGTNRLFSSEFGCIFMDEAWELSEDQFKKAGTRLRHRLTFGKLPPYKIYLASNPAQNWLKERFILSPTVEDQFIQALPKENPHNPPDYEAGLRDLFRGDDHFVQAFLEGSWDAVASVDDLFLMTDLRRCVNRQMVPANDLVKLKVISCDPARYGDDSTVIYCWDNYNVRDQEIIGVCGAMDLVGRLLYWESLMGSDVLFVVDEGNLGGGIVDRLKEMNKNVLPINFGSSSSQSRYFNKRSEMYFNLKALVNEQKINIPDDNVLLGELAGIKFKYRSDMQLWLEPKDEYKKRHGKSPDRADAFVMGIEGLKHQQVLFDKEEFKTTWNETQPAWVTKNQEYQIIGEFNRNMDYIGGYGA